MSLIQGGTSGAIQLNCRIVSETSVSDKLDGGSKGPKLLL